MKIKRENKNTNLEAKNMKLGFVVSEFNYDVTSLMLQRASGVNLYVLYQGVPVNLYRHVPCS